MFGVGYWELIILAVIGTICLGTIGAIVAAIVFASAGSRGRDEKMH